MSDSLPTRTYSLEYVDECLFFTATYFYLIYRILKIKKSTLKIISLSLLYISATSLLAFFMILVYLTKFYDIDKLYLEKVGRLEGSHFFYNFDIIPLFNWCLSLSNTLKISSMFMLIASPLPILYSIIRLPVSVFLDLFADLQDKTLIFYRSLIYGTETCMVLALFLSRGINNPLLNLCLFGECVFRFYINVIDVPVEIGDITMHVIKKSGIILMVLSYLVIVEIGKKVEKKMTKSHMNAIEFVDSDRNVLGFDDFPEEKMCER